MQQQAGEIWGYPPSKSDNVAATALKQTFVSIADKHIAERRESERGTDSLLLFYWIVPFVPFARLNLHCALERR